MQEPAMVNFLSSPAATQQFAAHGDNQSRPSLVPGSGFNFPPSVGGPKFNVIPGNVTKHDDSVHELNIGSHNTETNTIQNAFNDNFFVKSRKNVCVFYFSSLDIHTVWTTSTIISIQKGEEQETQSRPAVWNEKEK